MFQNLSAILTESTFSPHIFDTFQEFSQGKCGFIGENQKTFPPPKGGGVLAAQISKISQCLRKCITPPQKKSLEKHGFSPYFFHMFQHLYAILTESRFSPHIFDKFQGFSQGKCGFIGEHPMVSPPPPHFFF